MDSMLRRLVASWIKSQDRTPRRLPTAAVRCEGLEGRQLLSTMSLYRGNAVMPSTLSTSHNTSLSTRGTLNMQNSGGGQNVGGMMNVTAARSSFGQGGQGGGFRGLGQSMGGGVGRRIAGTRGFQSMGGARMDLPSINTTQATTLEATGQPNAVPASMPVVSEAAPTDSTLAATTADVTTTSAAVNVPVAGTIQATSAMPVPGGWNGWNGSQQVSFQGAPQGIGNGAPGGSAAGTSLTIAPSQAWSSEVDKLHTDLQAIQDKSEVTPKLLAAVRNDLKAIEDASTSEPDQAALETLANGLKGLDGQFPTDAQQAQLVADFKAVLQSQGITDQTLIDTAVADIQAVVAASHVTADDLSTIAADHEAIQAKMNSNAGTPPMATPTTNDLVGGLLTGLTGGLDVGPGGAGIGLQPFGGVFGGPIGVSPMTFSMTGPGDQGGPFSGEPAGDAATPLVQYGQVNATPGGGGQGGQFGPFRIAAQGGATISRFGGVSSDVAYANGNMGGQFARSSQPGWFPEGGGGSFGGVTGV